MNSVGSIYRPYAINIDVSPSGKEVVFEYNKQIWIMDIDGKNLKQLIRSDKTLKYPTWSQNQKYIAYLAQDSKEYFDNKIYFFQLDTFSLLARQDTPMLQDL